MLVPIKVFRIEDKSAKASVLQRLEAVFPCSKADYLAPLQYFNYTAQSSNLEQETDSKSNAPHPPGPSDC
jgi:hypothetical protein